MSDLQAFETAIAASAAKVSYGSGAAVATWGFVSSNPLGIVGLMIALATFFVNSYYQRRRDKREAEQDRRDAEHHEWRKRVAAHKK